MTFKIKSYFGFLGLFFYKGMKFIDAKALSTDYYKLEVLRQSNGFTFIIKKIYKYIQGLEIVELK